MSENEEKKDSKFKSVKNPNNYNDFYSNNTKSHSGFGKTVVVPFFSGLVGCSLVLGTCFGVPSIKDKIIGSANSSVQTSSSSPSTNNSSTSTLSNVSLSNYSDTSVYAANKILPSIVGITIEYNVSSSLNSFFGNKQQQTSTATASGSGIIIKSDGYILTNNHVVSTSSSNNSFYDISEATKITVKLYNDDTEYEAKIIGQDEQTDLAIIKIDKSDLTAAELADSSQVKVGEFAMAVGSPLGMESSITCGVISATNRQITDSDGKIFTLLQTDAAINSGNSGGALVNSEGKVIGVNTMKVSSTGVEGMGFAIPINSTLDITSQLIQYNKVKRPYIGIGGINLDEETAKANNLVKGVYVKTIEDFSAAEKAGIKVGDVIIEADGKSITTMDELNEIKNSHKIGDEMSLKINRDGKDIEVKVTLSEQP